MNIPGPRRRKRGQPHGDGLARILAPSVLAICVCTLCLCGTTWAWFTATASSGATVLQTGLSDRYHRRNRFYGNGGCSRACGWSMRHHPVRHRDGRGGGLLQRASGE